MKKIFLLLTLISLCPSGTRAMEHNASPPYRAMEYNAPPSPPSYDEAIRKPQFNRKDLPCLALLTCATGAMTLALYSKCPPMPITVMINCCTTGLPFVTCAAATACGCCAMLGAACTKEKANQPPAPQRQHMN